MIMFLMILKEKKKRKRKNKCNDEVPFIVDTHKKRNVLE